MIEYRVNTYFINLLFFFTYNVFSLFYYRNKVPIKVLIKEKYFISPIKINHSFNTVMIIINTEIHISL